MYYKKKKCSLGNIVSLSLVVLVFVFLGIALRQVFCIPLKIWQIMSIGAWIVLFTDKISFLDAWYAIDWGIIGFLFGMFVVSQALEESGYLSEITAKFFLRDFSSRYLVALIVFGLGILSAFLMNDTVAIMGTPVLIRVAYRKGLPTHPLLLGMAFAITIGSVMSPIGNPQNLFIAMRVPIANSFLTFISYLAIPTFVSLAILYLLVLKWVKKEEIVKDDNTCKSYNRRLMIYCRLALFFMLFLIVVNIIFSLTTVPYEVPLPLIALLPGCFLLIFAPKRKEILQKLDWQTLVFFIAMFILMYSVWQTSSIKEVLNRPSWMTQTTWGIMAISIGMSQLISNVPLVALYLPTIESLTHSTDLYIALAVGSTLAGNFLVFGAASNLIIIQNAEKRGDKGIDFFEFAKYGIPLTIVTFLIYWVFFYIIH